MARDKFIYAAISGLLAILATGAFALDPPAPSGESSGSSLLELPSMPAAPAAPPATVPTQTMPAARPPASAAGQATPTPTAAVPPAPVSPVTALPAGQPMSRVQTRRHPNASPTASAVSEMEQVEREIVSKNPDVLMEPMHLGKTSLMYNKDDMDIVLQALDLYDHSARAQKDNAAPKKDFLGNLLSTLKHDDTPQTAVPLPLPNLYLGSIVYYSPANWSVWINGRKLMNRNNGQDNEFYVGRLSRSEVELIWKPTSLLDTPEIWRQMTDDGTHPLPNITVDAENGRITLLLRPNQTFLPKSLAIREGLIKSASVRNASATDTSVPVAPNAANPNATAPSGGVPLMGKGRQQMMNPMAN